MANRFWVGGTNTWNATATGKWSTTSGGASGAAVPTSSDDVFFDANSGAGTVTIGSSVACKSITCTGFTGTLAGTSALAIAGSLTLVTGMTFGYTGTITFNATTTGQTITTAAKTLGSIIFASSGGGYTLQDNLTIGSTKTITQASTTANASFNANGHNVNVGGGLQVYAGNGCNWNFGSGTWTAPAGSGTLGLNGNAIWFVAGLTESVSPTSAVIIANSATLNVTSTAATDRAIAHLGEFSFGASPLEGFINVNVSSSPPTAGNVVLQGAYNSITITAPANILVESTLEFLSINATGSTGNIINILGFDGAGFPEQWYYLGTDGDTISCDYLKLGQSALSAYDKAGFPGFTPITITAIANHSTDAGDNTGWTFPSSPTNFNAFLLAGN